MRRIRIVRKRNPGKWGLAHCGANRIDLDPDLDDLTLMTVALHEVWHILNPDYDDDDEEDLAWEFGEIAADVLWRLGFRVQD